MVGTLVRLGPCLSRVSCSCLLAFQTVPEQALWGLGQGLLYPSHLAPCAFCSLGLSASMLDVD